MPGKLKLRKVSNRIFGFNSYAKAQRSTAAADSETLGGALSVVLSLRLLSGVIIAMLVTFPSA